MILVGDWSAEQREDAIARGLRHIAAVMMDGIHHQFERGIDDGSCFFGVEVLDKLH